MAELLKNRTGKKSWVTFTQGEISERLVTRSDLAVAGASARTVTNYQVGLYGLVQRRPGTQYIAAVK